jgi:hypothetical protein
MDVGKDGDQDIVDRWHRCPWYNAVELAGKLKISEAAPALGRWIVIRNSPLVVGLSSELELEPYPVATALWEIGNPSVPVLQHALDTRPRRVAFIAERALCIIDTPQSKATLREFLPRESDHWTRLMIKECVAP